MEYTIFSLNINDRYSIAVRPSTIYTNVLSAKLVMEVNGEFSITMTVRNGAVTPIVGNLIGVSISGSYFSNNLQKFVIKRTKETIDGSIEAYCEHISYDLLNYPLSPFGAQTVEGDLNDACTAVLEKSLVPNNFTLEGLVNGTESITLNLTPDNFANVREALGGREGSVMSQYYGMAYRFNNEVIQVIPDKTSVGANLGQYVYKGHNALSMSKEETILNTYDAILPYAKQEDANGVEQTVYLSTTTANNLTYPVLGTFSSKSVLVVDLSEKFDVLPSAADLKLVAAAYFSGNNIDQTTKTVEFEIADLSKALGLSETEINIFDKVDVFFQDTVYTMQISSLTINLLNGRREKVYVNRTILERRYF